MPAALMQETVLPGVHPLASDHAPNVRAALFDCAAQWAGAALPSLDGAGGDDEGRAANQCRTYLPLLLPPLLLGLTDEVEATRSTAYARLEAIGARFGDRRAPHSAAAAAIASGAQQPLPGYCHPFSAGPPSPGACRLVQAHLPRLLQQALAELREWTGGLPGSGAVVRFRSRLAGKPHAAAACEVRRWCLVGTPPYVHVPTCPQPIPLMPQPRCAWRRRACCGPRSSTARPRCCPSSPRWCTRFGRLWRMTMQVRGQVEVGGREWHAGRAGRPLPVGAHDSSCCRCMTACPAAPTPVCCRRGHPRSGLHARDRRQPAAAALAAAGL